MDKDYLGRDLWAARIPLKYGLADSAALVRFTLEG